MRTIFHLCLYCSTRVREIYLYQSPRGVQSGSKLYYSLRIRLILLNTGILKLNKITLSLESACLNSYLCVDEIEFWFSLIVILLHITRRQRVVSQLFVWKSGTGGLIWWQVEGKRWKVCVEERSRIYPWTNIRVSIITYFKRGTLSSKRISSGWLAPAIRLTHYP